MKKLNILALMVFLAAVVGVFTLNNRTTLEIQTRVMALLSPFIHSSAAIEESVRNATIPDIDPSVLRQDNERLQIEVEKLRVIAQKYNQALEEINQLRGQLEFKKSSPLNMTAARVVRRVSTSWWNTLIIDKGLLDGLGTDTPVITAEGLIGKTGKMAPHMAEVILLTDETCHVSAKVDGTLEQGILSGERGGLDLMPDLRLKYLNRSALISPGAAVVTTGEGGVFPAGLLIGRVKRFEVKDITGEAVVEPAVDLSQIRHVFLLDIQKEAGAMPR